MSTPAHKSPSGSELGVRVISPETAMNYIHDANISTRVYARFHYDAALHWMRVYYGSAFGGVVLGLVGSFAGLAMIPQTSTAVLVTSSLLILKSASTAIMTHINPGVLRKMHEDAGDQYKLLNQELSRVDPDTPLDDLRAIVTRAVRMQRKLTLDYDEPDARVLERIELDIVKRMQPPTDVHAIMVECDDSESDDAAPTARELRRRAGHYLSGLSPIGGFTQEEPIRGLMPVHDV